MLCALPVLNAPRIRLCWAVTAACDTCCGKGTTLPGHGGDRTAQLLQAFTGDEGASLVSNSRIKPHAGLRCRALDMQSFQKHLDLRCWSEVGDSTELFTGSAGLETQLSSHPRGRHTERLMLHTSTPHNSHLPVNGAPLPASSSSAVLPKVPTPKLAGGHASLELCPEGGSSFLPTVWEAQTANLSKSEGKQQSTTSTREGSAASCAPQPNPASLSPSGEWERPLHP